MAGIAGVIAIETSCAGVMATDVDPVIVPEVAEIFEFPTATLVARPVVEIVATVDVSELQVTELVRFWVLPSA
jgi:hypothetical protein